MNAPQTYQRFSLAQRLEHILALTSFTVLAVTGLPQKFAMMGWAQGMIAVFGGIEVTRDLHHLAALVLMVEVVVHLVHVSHQLYVRRARPAMFPSLRDVRDALGTLTYNLGRQTQRPPGGRYTFEEKVEYWAFVWGTIVMVITGFIMWNPIAITQFLPGEFIPAAKTVHGYEAVLAVLAILIWHFYSVHLRHFNTSMWTGQLTEHEMREEHPLELAELTAGATQSPLNPADLRKRGRRYYPVAGVAVVALVLGLYWFVTFEKTAIETVPPRLVSAAQTQAFWPLTPTPIPVIQPSPLPADLKPVWEGNIALLLEQRCSVCHGGLGGLDYSSYQSTLKGGKDGAVILPGDPDSSLIMKKLTEITHPGKLNAPELALLKAWIVAGAVEK